MVECGIFIEMPSSLKCVKVLLKEEVKRELYLIGELSKIVKTSGAEYVKNRFHMFYRNTLKYMYFVRVQPSLVRGVCSFPQLQQLLLNKCLFSCKIIVFMIVR